MRILGQAWRSRWLSWCVLALVHAGLAAFFLTDQSPGTAAARTGFPLDDAWIHMVYARSLAHSGLPCYNDGQPETGFTSPLWALVAAAAHGVALLLRGDVVLTVKIVGVLCALAGSIAVFELTRAYARSSAAALIAAALSALTPAIAFTQVAGMEPCLAAATGLWALHALEQRRYWTTGLLLAAAVWSRPEMLLLAALVAAGLLLHQRRRDLLCALVPVAAAILVWCGYCYIVTGWWLPNTFYAKFYGSVGGDLLTVVREQLWALPANGYAAGLVLYALGCYALLRHRSLTRVLVLLAPWVFFLAIAGSRSMPPTTGRYYYWLRYVVPGFPFLFVVLGVGWQWLWDRRTLHVPAATRTPAPRKRAELRSNSSVAELAADSLPAGRRNSVRIAGRVLAVVLVVVALVPYPQSLQAERVQFAWNCQNMNEVQVALGTWVATHTPADAVVAVNDAGAIRYFGGRRTIDLVGLNEHRLVHNRMKVVELRRSARAMRDYLRESEASYLIVFPSWFPALSQDPQAGQLFRPVHSASSAHYTVAPAPQSLMVVFVPQ